MYRLLFLQPSQRRKQLDSYYALSKQHLNLQLDLCKLKYRLLFLQPSQRRKQLVC
jgi:hypothetical protein